MLRQETLEFELPKNQILNSNTYKSLHWAVKGKLTEGLRSVAIETGLKLHPQESLSIIGERLALIEAQNQQKISKSRRTKILQKSGDYSAVEIKKMVEEEFTAEILPTVSGEVPFIFHNFSIGVTVYSPSKRRLDPVNLYPTVKAIIDGFTDVGLWEDDDYTHLASISFVYGGISGNKDAFRIKLTVVELSPEEKTLYPALA